MKASAKGRPVGVRENVQSLRTEKLADVRIASARCKNVRRGRPASVRHGRFCRSRTLFFEIVRMASARRPARGRFARNRPAPDDFTDACA